MSRVLIIESSARQQDSVSRQLTREFTQQWQAAHPTDTLALRDLALNPVPHLDADLLGGWMKPEAQRSAAEVQALLRSNELTDELPLFRSTTEIYTLSLHDALPIFDHVLRAGITFKYTPTGPQGLLSGKRAIVLTARGGIHAGASSDHQEPYLRQVMAFIGIHDVTFIHAEGLNMSGDFHEQGLNQAKAKLAVVA